MTIDSGAEMKHDEVKKSDNSSSSSSQVDDHYYYLTPQAVKCLPNFKYNGADLSPIYNHVLSPLAAFLVDRCTPKSVAPNTITLFGLCWMITSYSFIWYFCPMFEERVDLEGSEDSVPGWIFLFNGIAMFIYQTLDNMDGKQARRTGSSSSLGLLFDHGCDAINLIFGSANWIAYMGLNPTQHLPQIWVLVFIPMILFYIATWEEYYTGKLVLPYFNGPSEGLIIGASLSILTSVVGRHFWHETTVYSLLFDTILPTAITAHLPVAGITNSNMVVLASIIGAIREGSTKIYNVAKNYGLHPFINLLPVLMIAYLGFVICYLDAGVFIRNPRNCLHLVNLLFFDQVTSLMLNHMSCINFKPYRLPLLPVAIFALVLPSLSPEQIDSFMLTYTVGLFMYMAMKTTYIVSEICNILGIWCFDIVTPYPKRTLTTKVNDVGRKIN